MNLIKNINKHTRKIFLFLCVITIILIITNIILFATKLNWIAFGCIILNMLLLLIYISKALDYKISKRNIILSWIICSISISLTLVLSSVTVIHPQLIAIENGYYHYYGKNIVTQEQYDELITKYNIDKNSFSLNADGINFNYRFDNKEYIPYLDSEIATFKNDLQGDIIGHSFMFLLALSICFTTTKLIWEDNINISKRVKKHLIYLDSLKESFLIHNNITQKYDPQIIDKIKIPNETEGIIAIKCWNINFGGLLHSTGMGNLIYRNNIEISDKEPKRNNESGFYVYRIGSLCLSTISNYIYGIVEITQKYVEHSNGIIRGQRLKILCVITNENEKEIANKISSIYNIPVVITNNKEKEYYNWLYSEEGLKWLEHNQELLSDKKDKANKEEFNIINEAEKLLKENNK